MGKCKYPVNEKITDYRLWKGMEFDMHEMGMVVYVMETIEALAKENNFEKVACVTLEYGEVSSVEPSYLRDLWAYANEKSEVLKEAELRLEKLPAVTICNDCGKTYPTLEYSKICPECKSKNTELICGNEFNIKEIMVS